MTSGQGIWKIGDFEFDSWAGRLRKAGDAQWVTLAGPTARVLQFLAENVRVKYDNEKILTEAWDESVSDDNLYKCIQELRHQFGGERDEYIAPRPYRLVVDTRRINNVVPLSSDTSHLAMPQPAGPRIETSALPSPPTTTASSSTTQGFVVSVDGIILNSVGELIFREDQEKTIRQCRTSYWRALEDFAFALVYASQLRAKWQFEGNAPSAEVPSPKRQEEPGKAVVDLMPKGLYAFEHFDNDLHSNVVLANDEYRKKIGEYIRCMGLLLQDRHFLTFCRDWLTREADVFLRTDPTLFKDSEDPRDFHFGKQYYMHDFLSDVPNLLGEAGLSTLVNFLPERPEPKGDKYARSALVQFVVQNVLTHITTMYQFEKSAERYHRWRIPYALRAEILLRFSKIQMQSRLRGIVVRHALLSAVRKLGPSDGRRSIVTALTLVRDEWPFNEIRGLLEKLSLVIIEEDEGKEGLAKSLVEDIDKVGRGSNIQDDHLSFAHSAVLRELAKENSEEYVLRLSALFPELKPVGQGSPS